MLALGSRRVRAMPAEAPPASRPRRRVPTRACDSSGAATPSGAFRQDARTSRGRSPGAWPPTPSQVSLSRRVVRNASAAAFAMPVQTEWAMTSSTIPPLGPRKPVDGETDRLKVIRRVTRQVIAGEPEERAEASEAPSAVQATTAQQLEGKHGQGEDRRSHHNVHPDRVPVAEGEVALRQREGVASHDQGRREDHKEEAVEERRAATTPGQPSITRKDQQHQGSPKQQHGREDRRWQRVDGRLPNAEPGEDQVEHDGEGSADHRRRGGQSSLGLTWATGPDKHGHQHRDRGGAQEHTTESPSSERGHGRVHQHVNRTPNRAWSRPPLNFVEQPGCHRRGWGSAPLRTPFLNGNPESRSERANVSLPEFSTEANGRLELPTSASRNRFSSADLDATPQRTAGSRARPLPVPPGNPLVQTLDGHVVELRAVALRGGDVAARSYAGSDANGVTFRVVRSMTGR